MNLPSLSRPVLAAGLVSLLSAVSAYAALTPPYLLLQVYPSLGKVGSAVSGAAAHLNDHLYFAGGTTSSGSVTNVVSDVNLYKRDVTPLAPMPTARAGLGLVGFFNGTATGNDVLYAIGGTNGTSVLGTCEMYDVANGTWTEMAPMPTPRAYLAVVGGTDSKIYAIGGADASGNPLATVEVYNPQTNSWSEGPSLNTPRSHLAAILAYLDDIFVAGGDGASGTPLNTTELYSLSTQGSWIPWLPMNTPRADFGISVAADGYLHAFGGRSTGGTVVKTIEGYRFTTGVWTIEKHSLPYALSGFAATEALNGDVFLIGGKSGSKFEEITVRAHPPKVATHSVTYYVHSFDEPYVDGSFAMDEIPPLQGEGLLEIGLLSSTNITTFPSVTGTIEASGSLTVNIPATIILGVINGVTVSAENADGSDPVVLGSVSSLLGLSGNINIPITTPLVLRKKVLVLNLSTILGVDLNLGFQAPVTVVLDDLNGRPSNPQ
jgi:Kelch motif